ncbi:MAG: TIM barrel protein [Flavobacteriales bacterium]
MIYVSSSCVKASTVAEAVEKLVAEGYNNIELSGGTKNYPNLVSDLLSLKDKYSLNYLCHNYFPPPESDFVLNLASLDEEINQLSLNHVKRAIELSKKLGGNKFAFHAGFRINIPVNEIGKVIQKRPLFDRKQALDRFNTNLKHIHLEAGSVDIYVENNVLSSANFESYDRENPFFLTDSSGLDEIQIRPLLDVAHLYVSCNTLGLNLANELEKFIKRTDYIHISGNDGKSDSNQAIDVQSELFRELNNHNLAGKTITLEVYSGLKDLRTSFENIERINGGI